MTSPAQKPFDPCECGKCIECLASQACRCEIWVSERKEPREIIKFCPLHAAAGEMLNCLKASLKMTAELSRTMDDDHWYRNDLHEMASRLAKSIFRAEGKQ